MVSNFVNEDTSAGGFEQTPLDFGCQSQGRARFAARARQGWQSLASLFVECGDESADDTVCQEAVVEARRKFLNGVFRGPSPVRAHQAGKRIRTPVITTAAIHDPACQRRLSLSRRACSAFWELFGLDGFVKYSRCQILMCGYICFHDW